MTVQLSTLTFALVVKFLFIYSFKKYNKIKYKIKQNCHIEVGQDKPAEKKKRSREGIRIRLAYPHTQGTHKKCTILYMVTLQEPFIKNILALND